MQENTSQETQSTSEFAPTTGGGETADANVLMVSAYLIFWLLVALSIALSWRRQKLIGERLERLEQAVLKKGQNDAA